MSNIILFQKALKSDYFFNIIEWKIYFTSIIIFQLQW